MVSNVQAVLDLAESYVGYIEKASDRDLEDKTANAGSGNYTIFAKKYAEYGFGNYQGQPWCAVAVTVIFYDALGYDKASKILKPYSYCPYGVLEWKRIGRWHARSGYTPKPGDIIFFGSGGESTHTGIVRACYGGRVYTYEGNTSNGSTLVANGGEFCAKSYTESYSRIMGYGNPDWELIDGEDIDMEELNALKAKVQAIDDSLTNAYDILNNNIEPRLNKLEHPMIYNYIDDNMPAWARGGVKWCVDNGIVQGTGDGELGLDDEKLWVCTVIQRLAQLLETEECPEECAES
ncbi:MAG TPA: CHAP domain-containing protein [Candidatus Ornithomonoglobus intestinigallinarum]|uniref:CHAP domain-containing protein n=1 Tax=Candidatus Ornithomonoglobus intestinigallinarum TaxID=2840894 RepID=A0A9D1KPA4_9FIRM|nr:CHAP domain-containing protein [Candidatus Ornithomonoglobus intestinigallinarum]